VSAVPANAERIGGVDEGDSARWRIGGVDERDSARWRMGGVDEVISVGRG
jgi:hypothetical protein